MCVPVDLGMVYLCAGVAECCECICDTCGLCTELEKDCTFFRVDIGRVVRNGICICSCFAGLLLLFLLADKSSALKSI